MSCLSHYGPALLRFWFQTYLGHENSASYLKIQAGKTFSYYGHALVTLYHQFLFSDWSKFDRQVHGENLCSILKFVYFDSCYQESSFIDGWFVYWVLVEKCVACQSQKSDFGWQRFRFSPLMHKRVKKSEAILALLDSFQELHLE